MGKVSPSMAKNQITRCLRALIDYPSKDEFEILWDFFKSRCAYCGVELNKSLHTNHYDHIEPNSRGGTNSIYNFALSCKKCNGDEKRERPWLEFLREKCSDDALFETRRLTIENWISRKENINNTKMEEALEIIIAKTIRSFDASVAEVRRLKITQFDDQKS